MRPTWKLLLLVLAVAAPTAGDLGSCGQPAAELDPAIFFYEKALIDCQKCSRCVLGTAACERACTAPPASEFEAGCYPLVHDGEVCLNALDAAPCDEYASYVDDVAPTTPTECNFCPLSERLGSGGAP